VLTWIRDSRCCSITGQFHRSRTEGQRRDQTVDLPIQYTPTTLAAALEAAKDAKLIQDNVAIYKLVERPKPSIHKGQAWSEDEVRIFLQSVSGHRLETTWLI